MLPAFKNVANCDFIQGNSILLWQDKWVVAPLMETWPHLYSYCKNEGIYLKQAVFSQEACSLFHLPLSEEALPQFHLFQALLLNLEPSAGPDI
jgi:hypothetical protein